MTNPLDEDAVPLILDEPKHGKGRGISMTIRFTYALHVGTGVFRQVGVSCLVMYFFRV